MGMKLTIHPVDIRLTASDVDVAVGGVPVNLEKTLKLCQQAFLQNGDEAAFYQILGIQSPVGPRDMAKITTVDNQGNRTTGPGVLPSGNVPPPVPVPGVSPEQQQGMIPTPQTNLPPNPPLSAPAPGIHPPVGAPQQAVPVPPQQPPFPPGPPVMVPSGGSPHV